MPPKLLRRLEVLEDDSHKFPALLLPLQDLSPPYSSSSSYSFGSDMDCPLLDGGTSPKSPIAPLGVVPRRLGRIRVRSKQCLVLCFVVVSITVLTFRAANHLPPIDISKVQMSHLHPNVKYKYSLKTRFRDALKPDERYITSFLSAGWTNDVIGVIHTLLIALYSGRIPALPPFQPSHATWEAGFIKFSDVFSLPRLSASLNLTILEWADIKDTHSNTSKPHYEQYYGGEKEELGCWSLWMTQWAKGQLARGGRIPPGLNLDISYTPVPFGFKNHESLSINIHYLASLGLSFAREQAIAETKATYLTIMQETIDSTPEEKRVNDPPTEVPVPNGLGNKIDPDDQLLCFDFLFYTSPFTENKGKPDFDPEWQVVGKHLHFSDALTALSISYLRSSLTLAEGSPLPPLITVHVRRHDWARNCRELHVPLYDCLAPLSAYARRVDEVRSEILSSHPEWTSDDIKVILLSDEPRKDNWKSLKLGFAPGSSETWWSEVSALGWYSIDHDASETIKLHGEWYPTIIDSCILSMGHGFVGTWRSTYSGISAQRVAEWQGGPSRTVKWGKKGADDH